MIEMHQIQKPSWGHPAHDCSPEGICTSQSIDFEVQQSEYPFQSKPMQHEASCNNSSAAKIHSLRRLSQDLTIRRQSVDPIYGLYGSLLGLERDKIVDEGKEERKVRILTDLQRKNSLNARVIRRFSRKAALRKQPLPILPPNPASQPPRQPINSSRVLSKGRKSKEGNILDYLGHYSRMQERVEGALKQLRRDQRRTSILKSIVMNASDVLSERRLPCPFAPPISRWKPKEKTVMGKTFAVVKA